MRIYRVGGAVRDELLGLPVKDRDYVVVGASAEELLARGFQPVGKDFPVFLHPETHEEYALARTERKSGRGYRGFVVHAAPDVTLEQDLARRDLTINAMARDADGRLIDPYGGAADLAAGILRHVGPAFAEDPVRILRVARFAARFGFCVAPDTLALMRAMVANGEVDALVPERVWQELARGLMETRPARMFETLRDCGALARLLPEVERLFGVPQRADYHPEVDTGLHTLLVVDEAARLGASLAARFAALTHDIGKGTTPAHLLPRHHGHEARGARLIGPLCARLRVPAECRDTARLAARHHGNVHRAPALRPATLLDLLLAADALRRPARLEDLLAVCESDHRGRLGFSERPYPQADYVREACKIIAAVDAGALARAAADPHAIAAAVRKARLSALANWKKTRPAA
jgi:tRNA nucleotidyltransferase (CCA-adding enzyme)